MQVSVDYKWTTYGLDEDSDEYEEALSKVHLRSARLILDGCLKVQHWEGFCLLTFVCNKDEMFVNCHKIIVELTIFLYILYVHSSNLSLLVFKRRHLCW